MRPSHSQPAAALLRWHSTIMQDTRIMLRASCVFHLRAIRQQSMTHAEATERAASVMRLFMQDTRIMLRASCAFHLRAIRQQSMTHAEATERAASVMRLFM